MEEYTGPRTCGLCVYGRKLPCKNKGCNSANGLKDFRLLCGGEGDTTPTLFVSYHFFAPYESGEMHEDFGNMFLNVSEPTDEETLQKIQDMISENIRIRIGFKRSSVTVLNFKDLK